MEAPVPITVEVSRRCAWNVAADGTAVPAQTAETRPRVGYAWRALYTDLSRGPWRFAGELHAAVQQVERFLLCCR